MLKQRTIAQSVSTKGIGLHSSRMVELSLRPAAPNTGIVCHRVDSDAVVSIPADDISVGGNVMASILQKGSVVVSTVEHLMSALAGLGIDNIHIDLTAEQVPIMDGSAGTFVYLLRSAGLHEQPAPKKFFRVTRAIQVRERTGNHVKRARLEPYASVAVQVS